MIGWILSPFGRAFGAIGAAALAVLAIYGKGKRDAAVAAALERHKEANRRLTNAAQADDRMRTDIARGGLLEDDGYRRD